MKETIENLNKLRREFKSNWYVREPVYDSSVRAPNDYSGMILGIAALSFVIVPMTVGIVGIF